MSPAGREVTITIDGREVAAIEGEMLHDAARKGDVEIPFFCYEPKLGDPVGACRMCLVEIEGIPKLQTSCSTPVREGMVVHTRTEQVKEAQSAVVEFLLVNHPLDCPVCDKGGECPLQDISYGWGPGKSRVIDEKRHFEKPIELSPLVAIDRERCILCYRCVRFSQEVAEDAQLQLIERGDRTFVGTFDERPYVAPFHGNITDICPVGALTNYTYRFRARPWDIEHAGSVCTLCPSQCNVSFTVRDEKVKRVVTRDNAEVDDGWICDRGRYGFEMFDAPERVARAAAEGRRERLGRRVCGRRPRGCCGPAARSRRSSATPPTRRASCSSGWSARRSARPTSTRAPRADRGPSVLRRLAEPAVSARVRDIDEADAILVLGTDPLHSSPILDLRVRKAIRRNGAKLVVATERPTALDGGAEAIARYAPGQARPLRRRAGQRDRRRRERRRPGCRDACARPARSSSSGASGSPASPAPPRPSSTSPTAGTDGAACWKSPTPPTPAASARPASSPTPGPGLSETAAGQVHRGDPRGPDLRRARRPDPLRRRPPARLPRHASLGRGPDRRRLRRRLLDARERDHRQGRRSLPAGDPRRERRHRHPPRRPPPARPPQRRPPRRHPLQHQVLADLAANLGLDTGIDSQPTAFAALTAAVPFYNGITDSDIGGRGIRWQDRPGEAAEH